MFLNIEVLVHKVMNICMRIRQGHQFGRVVHQLPVGVTTLIMICHPPRLEDLIVTVSSEKQAPVV